MKNIVLIGMMGCGKSTCGRKLSRWLNRPLVDTDALIVQRQGRTVNEIFAAEGEDYFRDLETAVARELGEREGLIIATGGGLPLREENAEALRKNGIVIWLKRDPAETFSEKLAAGRPLAQSGREDFICRFHSREPLYRRAAHAIVEDFTDPDTTVRRILEAVERAERTQGGN